MLCNGLHGACRHLHFIGSLKPPRVELRRGGRSSGQLRLPPITEQSSNGQSSDNLMACWLFCLPCPSKVCSTAQWRCWRACGGELLFLHPCSEEAQATSGAVGAAG